MQTPIYELFAIRYATRDGRRADNFIGGDPHDAPMPMDYFVWVAKSPERIVVIDTGFTAETAAKRKREFLRDPVESLNLVGVNPTEVKDVILTHLHYDHVGNFDKFPAAHFHLQEPELHYAVGRYMQYPKLAHSFNVDDVVGIVRLNYGHRVKFYNGAAEFAPGIKLHPVGGHSAGLQFVTVNTARGWVVIASDATHYYENMESGRPYVTAFHIGEMLEAFDILRDTAEAPDRIVPGHDPLVMARYPAPSPDLQGAVVRLDVVPRSE